MDGDGGNAMILANEIQQPQYIGMTDAEIVAALNAVSATTRQRVAVLKAAINTTVSWTPPGGQVAARGIHAVITGTAPSCTVVYR